MHNFSLSVASSFLLTSVIFANFRLSGNKPLNKISLMQYVNIWYVKPYYLRIYRRTSAPGTLLLGTFWYFIHISQGLA